MTCVEEKCWKVEGLTLKAPSPPSAPAPAPAPSPFAPNCDSNRGNCTCDKCCEKGATCSSHEGKPDIDAACKSNATLGGADGGCTVGSGDYEGAPCAPSCCGARPPPVPDKCPQDPSATDTCIPTALGGTSPCLCSKTGAKCCTTGFVCNVKNGEEHGTCGPKPIKAPECVDGEKARFISKTFDSDSKITHCTLSCEGHGGCNPAFYNGVRKCAFVGNDSNTMICDYQERDFPNSACPGTFALAMAEKMASGSSLDSNITAITAIT